jgi:cysteine-rich repeat protein
VGADSDGDGLPDELDQCRYDSGCINDTQCTPFAPECAGCPAFLHADDDGDSVPNCIDACPNQDDHADLDGDSVVDCLDQCPTEPGCSTDCPILLVGCRGCPRFRFQDDDRDGVLNCVDTCAWANDSTDSDGDGSPDCADPCPAADDARDSDGDGVPDCQDDCPLVSDPDQADADHDGVGDACDDAAPPLAYRLLRTLRETTPSAGDQFGSAVAALPAPRRTILIGAPFEGAAHAGAAHVFDGSAGDCVTSGDHCEVLTPLDISDGAQFGRALAMHAAFKDIRLSGTSFPTPVVFAEIGGPEADGGRGTLASIALKFESTNGDFVLDLQQGIPLAPAADARFGGAVVARDAFMAVGAPGQSADGEGPENAFAGKAWVMNLQRNAFTVGAREIRPPRRTGGDLYGSALAISSAMVAVGAPGDSAHGADQAGAVHVFGLSGALLKTIENPHPADGDQFGSALAFVGNVLVVGAPRTHLGTLENVGSVYFFDLAGSPYGAMLGMTTPPDPSGGELFGFSIASLDDFAVVGAPGTMQGTGAAYLIDAQPLGALRHVSGHVEQVFLNPTPSPGDRFGTSVAAIPEDRQFGIFPGTLGNIVIGAPGDDFLHDGQVVPNAGAAYLYGFCGSFCRSECGNGMVEPNEDCDDGGIEGGDGCGVDCHVERCGDGVVVGTEQCDDGNKSGGDGCSSDCTIEDGYKCIGGPPSQCAKPVDPCATGPGIVVDCCACPTASCEDGNPCTDDRCDTERQIVVHVKSARKEMECDDHDDYTRDECNPQDGSCMHFPIVCPPYSQCVTQKYDPALRQCVPDQKIDGCCIDDSSCTGRDPCSDLHCRVCEGCEYADRPCCGQVASCVPGAQALPAGHECDDGDACTKNDVCAGGQCRGTLDCDDHDPCTDDYCDPVDGCKNKPIDGCRPCAGGTDAECDNGVYCDGVEKCEPQTLHCDIGTSIECPDDGDPCTSERCTEANQRCESPVVDDGTVKCRVQVGLRACTAPPEKTGQLFDHAVKLVDAMMALLGQGAAGDLPRDLARSSRRLLSEAQVALRRGALAARQAERQGQVAAECRDALADAARDGIKQLEELKTDRGLRRAKKARKRG